MSKTLKDVVSALPLWPIPDNTVLISIAVNASAVYCFTNHEEALIFQRYVAVKTFTVAEVKEKIEELSFVPSDYDAPKWANWKAKDESGSWFYYEKKPVKEGTGWVGDGNCFRVPAGHSAFSADWEGSLSPVSRKTRLRAGDRWIAEDGTEYAVVGKDPRNKDLYVLASTGTPDSPIVTLHEDEVHRPKPEPLKPHEFVHGESYTVGRSACRYTFVGLDPSDPSSGCFKREELGGGYECIPLNCLRPLPKAGGTSRIRRNLKQTNRSN